MTKVKNIILDLGGVVIRLATEEQWRKQLSDVIDFERYNDKKEDFLQFLLNFEKGNISNVEFLDVLYRHRKDEMIAMPQIINAWNSILKDYHPQTIQKLMAIKSKHRLFLLSNTNAIHEEAFVKISVEQYGRYILEDIFEKIYLSHQMGVRKPQREAYTMILEQNSLLLEDTLFIDDKVENIESARSVGLQVKLHPFNQFVGKSL